MPGSLSVSSGSHMQLGGIFLCLKTASSSSLIRHLVADTHHHVCMLNSFLSGLTLLVHHSSLSLIQSYAQHTVSPLLFSAHLSLQAYIQPLQHSGDVSCSTTPPSCQQGHHPVAVCRWPVPPGSFPRLHADCTGT